MRLFIFYCCMQTDFWPDPMIRRIDQKISMWTSDTIEICHILKNVLSPQKCLFSVERKRNFLKNLFAFLSRIQSRVSFLLCVHRRSSCTKSFLCCGYQNLCGKKCEAKIISNTIFLLNLLLVFKLASIN